MKKNLNAISIMILIFTACNYNSHKIYENKIKNEILKVIRTGQTGWNEGNWDKYMSQYLKSDSIRFVGKGNCTYGWETVMKNYKKGYPDKSAMGKLTFSNIDIKVLSDSSALVFGKWELERINDHPWGLFTLIWKLTPHGWKIIHDHTSSAE